jgi:ABC-type transport system involved in multi-copper enzyme maturation permease subunit
VPPILVVAHLTLVEARRRRILMAALAGGAAFVAVFGTAMFFVQAELEARNSSLVERQSVLTVLTIIGLYAANVLSALLAVLLPLDTLSGEIESGVIQTLATKPIPRADIVLGKWLGHFIVVLAYLTFTSVSVLVAARLAAGHVAVNAAPAMALMALQVAVLLSVSIAGGTRLTTVSNGVLAFSFYGVAFIAGWVEQIGSMAGIGSAQTLGVVVSLLSPTDVLWRMAAYHMQPAIVRTFVNGPILFVGKSVPSMAAVWWAAGFVAVAVSYAVRSLRRRAL